jgi:hypothetical protein
MTVLALMLAVAPLAAAQSGGMKGMEMDKKGMEMDKKGMDMGD